MKYICLIVALVSCLACNGGDPDDPTVVAQVLPGIGIQEIKLGESGQKAVDALGAGSNLYTKVNSVYYHYIVYVDKGIQVNLEGSAALAIDLTKKIDNIELFSPYTGQTEKETKLGSTQGEIRNAHGQPDVIDPFIPSDKYNAGIEFYYDETSLKTTKMIIDK